MLDLTIYIVSITIVVAAVVVDEDLYFVGWLFMDLFNFKINFKSKKNIIKNTQEKQQWCVCKQTNNNNNFNLIIINKNDYNELPTQADIQTDDINTGSKQTDTNNHTFTHIHLNTHI